MSCFFFNSLSWNFYILFPVPSLSSRFYLFRVVVNPFSDLLTVEFKLRYDAYEVM